VDPTKLVIRRGSTTIVAHIVGSTTLEGATAWKLGSIVPDLVVSLWFLLCAVIIAVRQAASPDGRLLVLILLCLIVGNGFLYFPNPNPTLTLGSFAALQIFTFLALVLLVRLSTRFGKRAAWRRLLEFAAYGAIVLAALWDGAFYVAIATLKFDPLPFWSETAGLDDVGATVVATIAVAAAVAATPSSQRARAGWLLLPLQFALLVAQCAWGLADYAVSWSGLMLGMIVAAASLIVGVLLVTYALVSRRVLDVGFFLSRTIQVSIVSLIIVVAFVLLEWILGSALAGVSRTAGLIANVALALALGISLNYIQKRVEGFVDAVLFRKRHEDERALLSFSKEAAYVTEPAALLDATLDKVRRHTDTQSAALLVANDGQYTQVRSFGEGAPLSVGENDGVILVLKTWHKPVDPHHADSALRAALALPMFARGKLYGVLALGERAGGEAYAPDEVDALSQLANGVGAALEALSPATNGEVTMAQQIEEIHRAIVRSAIGS